MKNSTFQKKIRYGLMAVWDAVKAHPVEIIILLYTCIVMCAWVSTGHVVVRKWWFQPLIVVPFTLVAAYSLHPLRQRGTGFRLLYALPLLLMVISCFMDLFDWTDSSSYLIAVFVAIPLWMLVRHWQTGNLPFVQRNAKMVWSLARSLLIAGILFALYWLIVYSITTLFDIKEQTWSGWYPQAAIVLFFGLAPILFFTFEDEQGVPTIQRFGEVILNWILTPALLIYTLVLYIYAAKILFTWTLPKGGVAVMVGVFMAVAFAVKMMQLLVERHPFGWFYDRFSIFALPLIVLFWTGVARRLTDYGLTETRYYLLLIGILMTLFVAVFLFKNRRGYFVLTAAALFVTLLVIFVPFFSGEKMAQRAQVHRVRHYAQMLDRLNDDGTLRLSEPNPADVEDAYEHRKLYQSLKYLDQIDTAVVTREFGLGCKSDYLASLSERTANYASAWSEEGAEEELVKGDEERNEEVQPRVTLSRVSNEPVKASGYERMYRNEVYSCDGEERLSIGGGRTISPDEIFREQLRLLGASERWSITREWLHEHEDELLVYRTDSLLVCFDRLGLERTDSGTWKVDSYEWVVLVR